MGGKVGRKANPAYVLGTAQHSFKLARTKFKTFMDGHDGLKVTNTGDGIRNFNFSKVFTSHINWISHAPARPTHPLPLLL